MCIVYVCCVCVLCMCMCRAAAPAVALQNLVSLVMSGMKGDDVNTADAEDHVTEVSALLQVHTHNLLFIVLSA